MAGIPVFLYLFDGPDVISHTYNHYLFTLSHGTLMILCITKQEKKRIDKLDVISFVRFS